MPTVFFLAMPAPAQADGYVPTATIDTAYADGFFGCATLNACGSACM
jgi:hypothetical protein